MARSKKYLENVRNIGIIAHIDAGKTTLTERILFYTRKIHRMGEVHEGTATMDFMPEEQERGITIMSACTTCEWNGRTVNIIDTPGHVDFTIEVERALRVLDGAVGVFCAVGGVEPQSETVWRQSEKFRVPKLVFVNKMDRLGADFEVVLESIRQRLKANPLPVIIPVGAGQDFEGIIDLVTMERLEFDQETDGEVYERRSLSADEEALAEPWRERLLEAASDYDEELLELYLGGEDVPSDKLRAAIRQGTLERAFIPVFAGSALRNIGVQPLIDGVGHYLPGPLETLPVEGVSHSGEKMTLACDPKAPFAALAFKVTMDGGRKLVLMRIYSGTLEAGQVVYNVTQGCEERVARLFRLHAGHREKLQDAVAGEIVAAAGMKLSRTGDTITLKDSQVILESIAEYRPVISLALEPRNKEEGDRLDEVLNKFLQEDPTLFFEEDPDTGQRLVSGMGELHLEILLKRLRREYGLEPRAGNPQVVYQETVSSTAEGEAEFQRELGEQMHHGFVSLSVEPLTRDRGRDIRFDIDTDQWPEAWTEAVYQGISDSLESGPSGYPVHDIRVSVTGMRRVDGQSSPVGFQMAAVNALRSALASAGPKLLEPIMQVEVSVPEEFVGDAISLLGSRGAKVENMLDRAGQKTVQALTPMRQLFGFATALRSATQGRAGLVMQFARFDVLG